MSNFLLGLSLGWLIPIMVNHYIDIDWKSFQLYRWWNGGSWAYHEGMWSKAGKGGYLSFGRASCHITYNGIEKREYYR